MVYLNNKYMQNTINFIFANWATIVTILFLGSELLASIPSIKANSFFQIIVKLLGMLKK